MPCVAVIHVTGRGTPGDGDWERDDIVEVFAARKRQGRIEMWINYMWIDCIGCGDNRGGERTAEHIFLQLFIPNATRVELYGELKVGRGMGIAAWRTHLSVSERARVDDPNQRTQVFERAPIVKSIIIKRP